MRYIRITIFLVLVGAAMLAAEAALRFFGSSYSLTDSKGPGQIAVFTIVLPSILLFTWYVALIDPLQFMARYLTQWRRTLKGFLLTFGVTVLVAAAGYLLLAALGNVRWSHEAWQDLGDALAAKIAVALIVVLMLAVTEELIFRSFLLRYLRYNNTLWVTVGAVVVSSAIFSASHFIALIGVWELVSKGPMLFGLFLIGILLGTTYVVTGSLACSIGVHCGLIGFKVILIKTQLLHLVPDWLVGGRADIQLAPLAWLVFLLMTRGRHPLAPLAAQDVLDRDRDVSRRGRRIQAPPRPPDPAASCRRPSVRTRLPADDRHIHSRSQFEADELVEGNGGRVRCVGVEIWPFAFFEDAARHEQREQPA